MKTCRDCISLGACDVPYEDEEIVKYTTGDIRTLCTLFKDKANYVEIVYCKDCTQYLPKSGRCWRMSTLMAADDYCSKGERKAE